jgi:hypothetical protein
MLQDTETKAMTNTKVGQKISYKQAQDALNVLEWKRFTVTVEGVRANI